MAAPTLSVQALQLSGAQVLDLVSLLAAATGAGDTYISTGVEFLVVNNGDASAKTVTLTYGYTIDGQTIPALSYVIAAGKIAVIPCLPPRFNSSADGYVHVTYSAVTNVKVGVFSVPRPV